MIGSSRQNQPPAETLRAPYASPQPNQAVSARESMAPRPLVPFVPRVFRELALREQQQREQALRDFSPREFSTRALTPRDMTVVPAVDYSADSFDAVKPAAPTAEFSSGNFERGDDALDAVSANFGDIAAASAEGAIADDVAAEHGHELPWIDAFAVDGEEAEETWPMGEAGRRLDELTDSLSSLDAKRARQRASAQSEAAGADVPVESTDATGAGASLEAPLPMWNEDEWIDIMPTSVRPFAQPLSQSTDVNQGGDRDVSADATGAEDSSELRSVYNDRSRGEIVPANAGAELTARALEALAQRIRAGELPVPEAQPDVAQEALLAGVLASMLGWRQ